MLSSMVLGFRLLVLVYVVSVSVSMDSNIGCSGCSDEG